jgi:hypothetical protein
MGLFYCTMPEAALAIHAGRKVQLFPGQAAEGRKRFLSLDWKTLGQRFESLHAPLGRWAPFAASALFAAARFSPGLLFRVLLYTCASVMALLVAIDIARSLLESDSPQAGVLHARQRRLQPVNITQVVLAIALACLYAFLIFLGMGPWTPFILLPAIFAFASIAAWRNARLWYARGAEYLEERAEVDQMLEDRILKSRDHREP